MTDSYSIQWWLKCFEVEFLKRRGTEFQTLFTRVMEQAHVSDFTQVRPWGNSGDEKCDGWLSSEKRLFQVYAPNEMKKYETETKMDEDFFGAVLNWPNRFEHWTFVHNSREGIPPFVLRKTLEYADDYPHIGFVPWGYSELENEVKSLKPEQLTTLFGFAPSSTAMQRVRFEDVEMVLKHVMASEAPNIADLRPVPKEKLEANSFSEEVKNFIILGMRKSGLVANYFKTHSDPRYGDALAYQFRKKYLGMKEVGLSSDEIFWNLRWF